MKKVLFATTALVGAGFIAAPASAADKLKVSVGGFMNQWVGYVDQDNYGANTTMDPATDFDTQSDTELYFRGSTTLDNGLTVGVNIDLEGDHGGGGVDDTFLSLSSDSYGTLIVGSTKHILYNIQQSAPDVGIGLADGDAGNWVEGGGGHLASDGTIGDLEVMHGMPTLFGSNDANKVKYTTPSFYGLTLGASYAPQEADGSGIANEVGNRTAGDSWAVGAIYSGEFEGVGVTLSGGGGRAGADDLFGCSGTAANCLHGASFYQGGAAFEYAGFTLSGGYLRVKQSLDQRAPDAGAADQTSVNGHSYSVGAAYATGPYAVSLGYGFTSVDASGNDPDEDEVETIMLSGSYNMGPGIDLRASVFSHSYEGEVQADNGNDDNDGWAFVTGMTVEF